MNLLFFTKYHELQVLLMRIFSWIMYDFNHIPIYLMCIDLSMLC
jgi:hypothetical protein